jgi:hypothetical protein
VNGGLFQWNFSKGFSEKIVFEHRPKKKRTIKLLSWDRASQESEGTDMTERNEVGAEVRDMEQRHLLDVLKDHCESSAFI